MWRRGAAANSESRSDGAVMACDRYLSIKIIELLGCIACVVLKRVTDHEAGRVFYLREKLSREWPLLSNITWDEHGAAFADVTFGGYVIITTGLIIAYVTRELPRASKQELFLLLLGAALFATVGALVLAALDSVPEELVDNAASLGVLALVVALIFLLDLGLARRRPQAIIRDESRQQVTAIKPTKAVQTDPFQAELRSSLKNLPSLTEWPSPRTPRRVTLNPNTITPHRPASDAETAVITIRPSSPSQPSPPPVPTLAPPKLQSQPKSKPGFYRTSWHSPPEAGAEQPATPTNNNTNGHGSAYGKPNKRKSMEEAEYQVLNPETMNIEPMTELPSHRRSIQNLSTSINNNNHNNNNANKNISAQPMKESLPWLHSPQTRRNFRHPDDPFHVAEHGNSMTTLLLSRWLKQRDRNTQV